jgi:hypothetical protein
MNEVYSKVTVVYINEYERPETLSIENARCAVIDGVWVAHTNTQAKAIPIERVVIIHAEGPF